MQRLHKFVIGENGLALAINFHLMVKSTFFSFSFQIYELRVVSWAYFSFLKDFLWFPNLFLKGGAVSPMYFSVAPSLEDIKGADSVLWAAAFSGCRFGLVLVENF